MSIDSTYPITIHWPAQAPVAVVGEKWRRRPNGQVEATYGSYEELEICLLITGWIREPVEPPAQQTLFACGPEDIREEIYYPERKTHERRTKQKKRSR